jgi:hypothetical protein
MASRDLHSNIRVRQVLDPQLLTGTDDSTPCDAADHQGFQSVEHVVFVGASGDTLSGSLKIELAIEESEDGESFEPVTDAGAVIGSVDEDGIFAVIDGAGEDAALYRVGYLGSKRYSRVNILRTGAHADGTVVAAAAILGDAETRPVEG